MGEAEEDVGAAGCPEASVGMPVRRATPRCEFRCRLALQLSALQRRSARLEHEARGVVATIRWAEKVADK
jgi:hypothetical protein